MIDLRAPESRQALQQFLSTQLLQPVDLKDLVLLVGGASRASWRFRIESSDGSQELVLRQDMGGEIHDDALSREQEFRVLRVMEQAGALVPKARWLCTDSGVLGAPFFVMDFVSGESIGRRIVKDNSLEQARQKLPVAMAQQLAKIHSVTSQAHDLSFLSPPGNLSPAHSALQSFRDVLTRIDEPHPVLELTHRWLEQHLPDVTEVVLCHGDFRVGNLLINKEGLQAVLDWEFVHWGDPIEDLAGPCVRARRFGRDELRLGGGGQPETFWQTYCDLTGRSIGDVRSRAHFWEVVGNYRWAVGCLQQAQRHLTGQTTSLELVSLGRRAAEVELELLNLVERSLNDE